MTIAVDLGRKANKQTNKNIGFLSNTGPDPLKITKPAFNVGSDPSEKTFWIRACSRFRERERERERTYGREMGCVASLGHLAVD